MWPRRLPCWKRPLIPTYPIWRQHCNSASFQATENRLGQLESRTLWWNDDLLIAAALDWKIAHPQVETILVTDDRLAFDYSVANINSVRSKSPTNFGLRHLTRHRRAEIQRLQRELLRPGAPAATGVCPFRQTRRAIWGDSRYRPPLPLAESQIAEEVRRHQQTYPLAQSVDYTFQCGRLNTRPASAPIGSLALLSDGEISWIRKRTQHLFWRKYAQHLRAHQHRTKCHRVALFNLPSRYRTPVQFLRKTSMFISLLPGWLYARASRPTRH